MKLEKDKVYKVRHDRALFEEDFPRDYIIFSPTKDIFFPEDFFNGIKGYGKNFYKQFNTVFTICFDGKVLAPAGTSVDRCVVFLPLTQEDYEDIRKAIKMFSKIGKNCFYNRKLNKLIFNVKEGACI